LLFAPAAVGGDATVVHARPQLSRDPLGGGKSATHTRGRSFLKHFSRWAATALAAALSIGAPAFSEEARPPRLVQVLQVEFAKRNSRATEVTLLDLAPHVEYRANTGYIVLARGIRPDHRFEGSFEDELFGVFLVDRNLSQVVQVLKFIASPRWYDYTFSIERINHASTPRTLILVGAGSTYGDDPKRLEIALPEPE